MIHRGALALALIGTEQRRIRGLPPRGLDALAQLFPFLVFLDRLADPSLKLPHPYILIYLALRVKYVALLGVLSSQLEAMQPL